MEQLRGESAEGICAVEMLFSLRTLVKIASPSETVGNGTQGLRESHGASSRATVD